MTYFKTIFLYGILLIFQLHSASASDIFVNEPDAVWNLSFNTTPSDALDSGGAVLIDFFSDIFVSNASAVWTSGFAVTPSEALDSGEAVPIDFLSDIFVRNAGAVWTPDLAATPSDALDSSDAAPIDFYSDIFVSNASTVWTPALHTSPEEALDSVDAKLILNETGSTNKSFLETIVTQNSTVNTVITEDLNGSLNLTNFEMVSINSGSFAGKGFSRGDWSAVIENLSYEGSWEGMFYNRSDERKIYLKGTISGGLKGIVEGYLSESVNGSGVYDQYQATWTIKKMDIYLVYSKIDLKGIVNYQSKNEYSSDLYALQTSVNGKISGYYDGSVDIVLTHVGINNNLSLYHGKGFSVITYVSESGSGEGWTYDEEISDGILEMNGFFSQPLLGIVNGVLDGTGTQKTISMTIERIDGGLPPAPDLKVKVWGPERVSPGQTIDYIIEYRNDGLKAAENMSLIFFPSLLTYHISASSNGSYDDLIHTERWNLTVIPPKSINKVYYKSNVMWGLQQGELLAFNAFIFPYEKANDILQHDTPSLTDILRKANDFIRGTVQGFLTSIFSQATGIGELVGVAELGPPGIYLNSIKWAEAMMEKMSAENAFQYWNEVLDILNNINNNPTYIKDNYPGETFKSLVEKLAQKYGVQGSMANIKDDGEYHSTITVARDPNIKYGPEGFVLPVQKLNYTVEYENEGEGSAFGVYFTDTLDDYLDASTLETGPVISTKDGSIIAPSGTYNPSTRTITWLVGEVGSREGGYANLSVNVRSDAEEGTEIINYATVYFPSVPETTRTNGIVSVVDITPPRYSNVNQNKSVVTAGQVNEVYAYWEDGVQLNQTWLETNESETWENVSQLNLSRTHMWSNFSILTKNDGTICWRIHANDTAGNENATPVLCFDVHLDTTPPAVTNATANQTDIPDDTDQIPLWGETAQLNVSVIDDSSVLSVTVNLSQIGESAEKPMINIGGSIYSTTTNASAGTPPGLYNLTVNATDANGNSNTSVKILLKLVMNGDTTGNKIVNIGDALRLANNVSYPGNSVYTLYSIYAADVTGNGIINIGDALRLANNVSYPGNMTYMLK